MFDWDDVRIFIAAARAGSLGGAATRLGIDAATVGRRVARLESALKSTLVVRSASGLQLTAAGAQLLQVGLEAESAMDAAARVAQPDVVAGTVRAKNARTVAVSSAVSAGSAPGRVSRVSPLSTRRPTPSSKGRSCASERTRLARSP